MLQLFLRNRLKSKQVKMSAFIDIRRTMYYDEHSIKSNVTRTYFAHQFPRVTFVSGKILYGLTTEMRLHDRRFI